MPNLINQDGAGNTFYNYITPTIRGQTINPTNVYFLDSFLATHLGAKNTTWSSDDFQQYGIRFPASGLEMKTGAVNAVSYGDQRVVFATNSHFISVNTTNTTGRASNAVSISPAYANNVSASNVVFSVINNFSIVYCAFSDFTLSSLNTFFYLGWLREPAYTGTTVGIRGLCAIRWVNTASLSAIRPASENSTTAITLSTAANAITSPPISCTVGTASATGEATFTDIVIRDAASPNNPVGKLWNCIDMPATCNVGELWRNNGAYDGDGTASTQDVYLCVMPWGTRKLGMRVWTESVN